MHGDPVKSGSPSIMHQRSCRHQKHNVANDRKGTACYHDGSSCLDLVREVSAEDYTHESCDVLLISISALFQRDHFESVRVIPNPHLSKMLVKSFKQTGWGSKSNSQDSLAAL